MPHAPQSLHLGIDASNIRQGGGVTHLSQLLAAAEPQAAGIGRVTVWACQATVASLPRHAWLSTRSPAWTEAGLPRRLLGQQFLLTSALADAGCDVLFSPGGTLPARAGLPTVTMSQNLLPFEPREALRFGRWSPMRLKMRLLRASQGRSFARADGLIFLTRYAQSVVSRQVRGGVRASALIPHGIEPRFQQAPRRQRAFEEFTAQAPLQVLYVSILMPYKHQREVALAASALRSQGLPLVVRFIGASWGDGGVRLRQLLDALDPAGEFLHWSGPEPFEALHRHYQAADACVFASSCENLPNILIEAMAAGVPIACSDRGPMPEVLGEAGVYFDPEQPQQIADALGQLARDAALRARLAQAAWLGAQAYSWGRCARDTFAFVAQVARARMAAAAQ